MEAGDSTSNGHQTRAEDSTATNSSITASTNAGHNNQNFVSEMWWVRDPSDRTSEYYLEHLRQVEPSYWNGGSNIFDGEHDDFCYVCGGTMELFPCQTCSTSYHASCMSPTVKPPEVPPFWFCPHCVDREWNVPPGGSPKTHFTPVPPPRTSLPPRTTPAYISPISPVPSQSKETLPNDSVAVSTKSPKATQYTSASRARLDKEVNPQASGSGAAIPQSTSKAIKSTINRPRKSYSPPRKRSKYSAFSSEVDKALAVIHKELEAAATGGKCEDSLRDRIQALEQELKLKDGQIQLVTRGLELTRAGGENTEKLKSENAELKEQNQKLREAVEKKDAELRDWRERLKSMIGGDLG